MLDNLRLLKTVSRPEFLPANLSSLVMGVAWSVNPSLGRMIWQTILLVGLNLAVLTFVSAIGAQLNTLSDHELDSKEPRKQYLVQALNEFGQGRLKQVIILEFLLGLPFFALVILVQPKPVLFLLWILGHVVAYAYSMAPFRLKCRSWLAMISLLLVLSILPVSFVYFTFADTLNPLFLLFLVGEALNVYAVIIPTETRDYWIDKANGVRTMTVWLGLAKASIMAIALLVVGGTLMATAFVLVVFNSVPFVLVCSLAILLADIIILRNYRKLYTLARQYDARGEARLAEEIVELSAHNPKWINLAQQSIVVLAIGLILARLPILLFA